MVLLLSLFEIFIPLNLWAADVQFEGYYRIESGDKQIGYYIQRYETDPKQKIIRSAYFVKTNELGGDIQESLKAEAKTKDKSEFEPISYSYTGKVGKKLKTIDAVFKKGNIMEVKKTDSDKKDQLKSETYKIPSGTFLSTFAGYLFLQKGLKVGKKFTYSAVDEEEGNSYNGEAIVKSEETFAGQNVFKIENTFKKQKFISYVTPQGEVLGVVMPSNGIKQFLVANPAEATAGFDVPNKSLVLTFGSIPGGKINVLVKNNKPADKKPDGKKPNPAPQVKVEPPTEEE
jgi:hypothetical protein